MSSRQGLERWLARRLVEVPVPEGLTLRHADAETGGSDLVARVREVPKGDPVVVARAAAGDLWERASEHAMAWPGRPQRYRVVALAGGKGSGAYTILVCAEGRAGGAAVVNGSEPPTPGGLLAQHMRFTEAAVRTSLEAQTALIDSQRRQIEAYQAQQERLLSDRLAVVEQLERLLSEGADREIRRADAQAKRDQRAELVGTLLKKGLPKLTDAIEPVAKRILTGGKTIDLEAKLRALVPAIPMDVLRTLYESLPPEQRGNLNDLLNAFADEDTHGPD